MTILRKLLPARNPNTSEYVITDVKKTVQHPRLGAITIFRTRRARRILLSVRRSGEIRLTLPARCTEKEGLAFLASKEQWVTDTLSRNEAFRPGPIPETGYSTARHTMRFIVIPTGRKISTRITSDTIDIYVPEGIPVHSEEIQSAARRAALETLRREAKETLPDMVAAAARRHGFTYGKVSVRATHSRWGSCSSRDDISLSIFLMRLPEELIEYVILHELCHTRHKDHSPAFHALLDSLCGGREKELSKRLRTYRPDVI